jgi:hypothetical protein
MSPAKDEDEEDQAPPPVLPGQPRRYWIHVGGQVRGPYGVRVLRHFKDLSAELLAAPAGSQREKDWRPVSDYPDLKAVLDERAAAAKPKEPPPKKAKPKRPPLQPLPEGPNYLMLFFIFMLAGAAGLAYLVHRGSTPEAPPVAAALPSAEVATPEQMWPAPGLTDEREAAEEQLLTAYFPLLLSVKGVNADQLAPTCDAAKEFGATYEAYKGKYGGAQVDELSQRLTVSMRADNRTVKLLKVLEQANSHGVDLTALKFPQQLRQNMQASDFSLQHALGNARQLLTTVCAKR